MNTHLENELEQIKIKIYNMADFTIDTILKAITALKEADTAAAKTIIENDSYLDNLEVEIDNECVRILVTQQPAATHLRFVLSMLKINTDLERIGDLATNIAKETVRLNGKPTIKPLVDIPRMSNLAIDMLRDSFKAIAEQDANLAREVIERDAAIDELNIQVYRELFTYMAEKPNIISQSLSLIMVAKAIERIGDHVTNIAERAVYFIEGVDIRHADIE